MKEKKIWGVPLTTSKSKLRDKSCDMQLVGALSLVSKSGTNDGDRFVYANTLDKRALAESMNKSIATVNRRLLLARKSKCNIIRAMNTKNGIVDKIKYATNKREYVVINSDMLECLVKNTSSNTIKIYLLFCYNLKDGVKRVTFEYLAKEIGICEKSGNSRKTLSDITDELVKYGFIIKYQKEFQRRFWDKEKQKEVFSPIRGYEYELCSYEYWLKFNEK